MVSAGEARLRVEGLTANRDGPPGGEKSKELDVSHLRPAICIRRSTTAQPVALPEVPRPVALRPAGCLVQLVDLDDALGEFRQDFKLAAKGFDDLPQRRDLHIGLFQYRLHGKKSRPVPR